MQNTIQQSDVCSSFTKNITDKFYIKSCNKKHSLIRDLPISNHGQALCAPTTYDMSYDGECFSVMITGTSFSQHKIGSTKGIN